jgi:preprotein translocase subunit YajC
MLISEAWAQGGGAGGGDIFSMMFPLLLIFAVFYFLLIRPQQKKMKEHREMLVAVRRGDKVVTGGGIIGTVAKVISDDELQVEISEGVKVKISRATLASVMSKTEPVKDSGETKKPEAANDSGGTEVKKEGGGSLLGRLMGKD